MAEASVDGPLLRAEGLSKSFGAVQALADVDLDLPAGQVTALCGDNGAGKSVLIKCISGIYEPERGHLFWEGRPVRIKNARDASSLGIETVYQDLALADNLDIVQNMFLGRERLRHRLLDENDMERAAAETLAGLRVTTVRSIRQPVGSLSGGQRLREHGLAVLVISHNLNDVFAVADRIAVLYLGRMVAQDKASTFDRQSVVEYMTTGTASARTATP